MGIYTNLTTNNTFGPYGGTLANGGERLTLAAADYDAVPNPGGGSTIEKLLVPASDLIYGDGGKWGHWSDGLGSSLELIDVEGDERHPSNWADSNDTGESLWTAIEWTGPLGETLGTPANDSLIINLQGTGECLLDEVEVRADNGPNLVANGGFDPAWTDGRSKARTIFRALRTKASPAAKACTCAPVRAETINPTASSPRRSPVPYRPALAPSPSAPKSAGFAAFPSCCSGSMAAPRKPTPHGSSAKTWHTGRGQQPSHRQCRSGDLRSEALAASASRRRTRRGDGTCHGSAGAGDDEPALPR